MRIRRREAYRRPRPRQSGNAWQPWAFRSHCRGDAERKRMRYLITGGAGFIGCNAAATFKRQGHEVL
ncbi:MAG: hypothetical protein ACODAG_04720, partial [Myxococcota bacterium]